MRAAMPQAGLLLAGCLLAGAVAALADARKAPYCHYLDEADEPAWEVRGGWISSARVEGPGGQSFSVAGVQGGGGLYFGEAPGGAVELSGYYGGLFHDGDGGIGLPEAVMDLHLQAGYVWRHWDGRSLRLRAEPGFYGEVEALGDTAPLRVPFEVLGLQALGPRLSGQFGVAVYPGFTRAFDPRFGLRYALTDAWSVDAGYPESRLRWRDAAGAEAYVYLRNQPVQEFWLEDGEARRTFRFEDTRLCAGWAGPVASGLRLRLEAGWVFNRAVDFARGAAARSVEDGWLVSAGLGGAL